jgi:hypothetical protein
MIQVTLFCFLFVHVFIVFASNYFMIHLSVVE